AANDPRNEDLRASSYFRVFVVPAQTREKWMRKLFAAVIVGIGCATYAAAQTTVMPIVDHIHLNVPDQAKGVEWYQRYFGGKPIEVVQDSEKLGLHHMHLRGPDPAATLAWYKDKFGGETAKMKNRLDGLKYTDVWILVTRGDAVPSEGHAVDHIGWRTPNL